MGPKIGPMTIQPLKDRLIRTLIMAVIGICLGAIVAGISLLGHQKPQDGNPPILNVAGIGGPWELKDQSGKIRTDKDFNSVYKLIYFGFTSCPAICPTELQKTAQAYKQLPADTQKQIKMLFVTVDPERDTPKVLKNYTALFHPDLLGLTGTPAQIEGIKQAYKVYGEKVPDGDSYTMDHSSFVYFMSPDDKLIALFKTTQTPDDIAHFISKYFAENSKP